MSAPVKLMTSIGSVGIQLKTESRKLTVTSDGPSKINNIACSIHLTYRMSGKSLRPMSMEIYSYPKHELIPGSLAQIASQLMLPVAIQWLASQKLPGVA
jgi:hypothetical protein